MNMKKLTLLLSAVIISLGALAADPVSAYFTVSPKMSCANCESKIKTNLRYEKGVKKIDTSIENQLVTITYDPAKTSADKLVGAFKKIGYEATEVKDAPKSCSGKGGACCGKHDAKESKKADCCSDKK